MAMENPYDGGIGGKFRKRPFRRPAATPYDRPAAAARPGLRGLAAAEGERSGWLSKLVDPASRMIASGASMLFSSVFRKRLGAPPPPLPSPPPATPTLQESPATDIEPREEVAELVSVNRSSNDINNDGSKDGEAPKGTSDGYGISELEKLLKQKTFTRIEFDRLTEVLRSRTTGVLSDAEKEKNEPSSSKLLDQLNKEENKIVSVQENGTRGSKLFGSMSKPPSLNLREEEIASPTELAKAYMGSRPVKPSLPLALRQSTARTEIAASPSGSAFMPNTADASIAPRSAVRFSGLSESGYRTPCSRGRSAIYMMSRSPYFNSQSTVPLKSEESYGGLSTSQRIPVDTSLSASKQVLKRRSSVLDNDIGVGAVGSIRRIRQKSNLVSPSKERIFTPSGRYLSTPATIGLQGATTSVEKAFPLAQHKNSAIEDVENGADKLSCANSASVPHQSTQMARKIFEHLECLSPPKEKISQLKAITGDDSPSKLTFNMLNGQVSKTLKDIDSKNIFNFEGNAKLDGSGGSGLKIPVVSALQAPDRPENNGPMRPIFSGIKVTSEALGLDGVVASDDAKLAGLKGGYIFSGSAVSPLQKKSAFQMQAPESPLELDADNHGGKDAPIYAINEKEYLESSSGEPKHVTSEAKFQKVPIGSSSDSRPDSGSLSSKKNEQKIQEQFAFRSGNGFAFPAVSSESSPPTPSMPPLSDQSDPSKDHSPPLFSFGSRKVPALKFSSTPTIGDSTGPRFGLRPDSISSISSCITSTTKTQMEVPTSIEVNKTEKGVESSRSFGSSILGISTPTTPVFSFGAPVTANLSNGSLKSSSLTMSVPGALSGQVTEKLSGSITTTSSVASSILGSQSTPASTSVPILSSVSTPLFGSSTSFVSTEPVSRQVVQAESKDTDSKQFKVSPFGFTSASTPVTSAFLSSGSSMFGFNGASSGASFGSTSGQFGSQTSQPATESSIFAQSSTSLFSSSASPSTSVLGNSSLPTFGTPAVGSSTTGVKPFSFGLSSASGQSSAALFTAGAGTEGSSSSPSIASPVTSSNLFSWSSSSSLSSPAPAPSSNLFGTSSSSSFASAATSSSLFSSTSQPATPSIFGSGFGSGASASTGFSFGLSAATSGTPLISFGSPMPPFSFMSTPTTTASASASSPGSIFGSQAPVTFSSSSFGGNDQMCVEDTMTDDTVQPAMHMAPVFGQVPSSAASNLSFGSPALQTGGTIPFHISSQPTPAFGQTPIPASGNTEFNAGGSFSLGSGGGDKSGRRKVKVKRTVKGRK